MTGYGEGKPLELRPSFIAMLCVCYWFDPIGSFWPFLTSVLFHEAGHLLALQMLKVPVSCLKMTAFGAEISTPPLSFSREIVAAGAGPLMNLLLFYVTQKRLPVMALINLGQLAFNFLPFYPLDGGRMLRAVLHLLCSDRRATLLEQIAAALGLALLFGISVYLTVFRRAGSWPLLLCGLLFGKLWLTHRREGAFSRAPSR